MSIHNAQGNFIMPPRIPADQAGLIFDGAAGQVYNDYRVITLARTWDFPMSTMDEEHLAIYRGATDWAKTCDADRIAHAADIVTQQGGMVDDAVEWLNDHAAPAGHWFTFDDGDFCLIAEEVEEA